MSAIFDRMDRLAAEKYAEAILDTRDHAQRTDELCPQSVDDTTATRGKQYLPTFDTGTVLGRTDYRYDLMSPYLCDLIFVAEEHYRTLANFLLELWQYAETDNSRFLLETLEKFVRATATPFSVPHLYAQALHEWTVQYEGRCWEKGIPEEELVNHALYHLFQFYAGDQSENHLSQLVWYVITIIHFQSRQEYERQGDHQS